VFHNKTYSNAFNEEDDAVSFAGTKAAALATRVARIAVFISTVGGRNCDRGLF